MFALSVLDNGSVKFSGRLDASEADRAKAELKSINRSVTADFSELDYISSAGLGIIVETYKRLHDAGHSLRLVHLSPRIRSIFVYAGLDKVLLIE